MDVLGRDSEFLSYIAQRLKRESFVLVDVGCSGGIADHWRAFGPRLRAFGFDPNISECKRLQDEEPSDQVEYVPAFLKGDPETEKAFAGKPRFGASPWERLSANRSAEIRRPQLVSSHDLTAQNQWHLTDLADDNEAVVLADFLSERGVKDVDFIKIDVDGEDLVILKSLLGSLGDLQVLGVCLEVSYFGTTSETDHTFHNMDRLMRGAGFDLFDLTVRRYSAATLPSPYEGPMPAQSLQGRPLLGDALYLRDFCAPHLQSQVAAASTEKLAKLAALLATAGLPDHAAEVFVSNRERLDGDFDVDATLDLLASKIKRSETAGDGAAESYVAHMAAFERDDESFYNGAHPGPAWVPARERRITELEGQVEALEREAEARQGTIEVLEGEVEALRASMSWKLTSPLRAVFRLFS